MLNLNFSLENPFGSKFKNLGCLSTKITEHKACELQHCYDATTLLQVEFNYAIRRDHAGLKVTFTLFGYTLYFQLYDVRHWNYNTNKWSTE